MTLTRGAFFVRIRHAGGAFDTLSSKWMRHALMTGKNA